MTSTRTVTHQELVNQEQSLEGAEDPVQNINSPGATPGTVWGDNVSGSPNAPDMDRPDAPGPAGQMGSGLMKYAVRKSTAP